MRRYLFAAGAVLLASLTLFCGGAVAAAVTGNGFHLPRLDRLERFGGRSPPPRRAPQEVSEPFIFEITETQNGSAPCTGGDLVARYAGAEHPITVTRSTSAWCAKGNEARDIANGDLVLIAPNKGRWMPGGEGDGGLGLAVWAARTNYLLWSEELANVAWRKIGCVAGVCAEGTGITVTANAATGPDGTLSAEKVECGSSCYVTQDVCPVDYVLRSVYLRLESLPDGGVDTNGLPDGGSADGGVPDFEIGGNTATRHGVTSASWTWLSHDDQADNAVYWGVYYYNGTTLPAKTFYLWGADCQRNSAGGVRATHPHPPHITTTTAAVTTADEVVQVPNYTPAWSDMTWSATVLPQNSPIDGVVMTTGTSIDGVALFVANTNRLTCRNVVGGVANNVIGTPAVGTNTQVNLSCEYNGLGQIEACTGSTCLDGGSAVLRRGLTTTIGSEWNGFVYANFFNGVIKNPRFESSAVFDIDLFGNSIVEGNGAGAGHQPQFIIHEQIGNEVAISNNGVSGYTIEQCHTAWSAVVANVVSSGYAPRSRMMVQCGINSSGAPADGGTAVSNVTSHLQAMLMEGRDAGIQVLWSTMTPSTATCASLATPVNSAMTTFCNANGIAIADTFTILKDPGSCALASWADFGDALHLNDAGVYAETQEWISKGGWQPRRPSLSARHRPRSTSAAPPRRHHAPIAPDRIFGGLAQ